MDRDDFKLQITSFNNNDQQIPLRALQTAHNFYQDPRAFIDSVADAPTPEHLWNIGQSAIKEDDVNVVIALCAVAQTSMQHVAVAMHAAEDAVAKEQHRDKLENYGHVVDMLDEYLKIAFPDTEQ